MDPRIFRCSGSEKKSVNISMAPMPPSDSTASARSWHTFSRQMSDCSARSMSVMSVTFSMKTGMTPIATIRDTLLGNASMRWLKALHASSAISGLYSLRRHVSSPGMTVSGRRPIRSSSVDIDSCSHSSVSAWNCSPSSGFSRRAAMLEMRLPCIPGSSSPRSLTCFIRSCACALGPPPPDMASVSSSPSSSAASSCSSSSSPAPPKKAAEAAAAAASPEEDDDDDDDCDESDRSCGGGGGGGETLFALVFLLRLAGGGVGFAWVEGGCCCGCCCCCFWSSSGAGVVAFCWLLFFFLRVLFTTVFVGFRRAVAVVPALAGAEVAAAGGFLSVASAACAVVLVLSFCVWDFFLEDPPDIHSQRLSQVHVWGGGGRCTCVCMCVHLQ
eukprot:Rhum_TRINITY_DN12946_c1_g1::Rhum_TRINITY_DN12946_c1_g1_i1::g.55631::m.55631